jgi:hypothetical protein
MLLVELRAKPDGLQAEDMHSALNQPGVLECSLEMVKETIDKMIEAGHRYKYLEAKFGCGVALVLGKDVPESMCAFMTHPFVLIELTNCRWTRALPKSGPDSNKIVNHLRSVKLPELAAKYSELQKTVIEYRLRSLDPGTYGMEDTAMVDAVGTAPIFAPVTVSPLDMGCPFLQDMEVPEWLPVYGEETFDRWE